MATRTGQHFDLKLLQHPSNVAVLSFVQRDFQPTVALAATQNADVPDAKYISHLSS